MAHYRIVLHWMYPKGQLKDRRGNVIQNGDPLPHTHICFGHFDSDEAAKDKGRELWKYNFVGKEKKLLIFKELEIPVYSRPINNYELIFEFFK